MVANSSSWFSLEHSIVQQANAVVVTVANPSSLSVVVEHMAPDIIFAPHWNWKIPLSITEKSKTVVFHTAPLPFGRGGSPIQNLILRGFTSAPVNAIEAIEEVDAGPILLSEEIDLQGSLEQILASLNNACNKMIGKIIREYPYPQAQKGQPLTFNRLTPEDNRLVGDEASLLNLYDKIRMVDAPNYPKSFLEIGNFLFEFRGAELENSGELKAQVRITDLRPSGNFKREKPANS